MQNQELRNFVSKIIEEKKLTGVEQHIKDKLIDELTLNLEDQINRALVNQLNDTQLKEFESLVESKDTARLATYFTDQDIQVKHVVTEAMMKFRTMYLGV
jgi:hypothetical protein